MPPVSDLVRDSQLKTQFSPKYTRHVFYVSGETPRQRKVRREERWERGERLGSGSFGTVWLEKSTAEQTNVKYRAVKEIRKAQRGSKAIDYSRELEAIAKFSHEKYELCFVKSYGWFENDDSVFIAMEYFPDGDLSSYLSSPLPEVEVQQITSQILEGLSFMHDNGFAHRDLKPSNILVKSKSPDWWVKVGDFGISKRAEEGLTALRTFNGTPGFLAPELLVQSGLLDCKSLDFGNEYTTAVDIWALGEIVFRALTGQPPFTRSLGAYVRGTSAFPIDVMLSHNISEQGREFVKGLMAPLPNDRPTAPNALEHAWMETLRPSSPKSLLELERPESPSEATTVAASSKTTSADQVDPSWLDEASNCWSTVDVAALDGAPSGIPTGINDAEGEPAQLRDESGNIGKGLDASSRPQPATLTIRALNEKKSMEVKDDPGRVRDTGAVPSVAPRVGDSSRSSSPKRHTSADPSITNRFLTVELGEPYPAKEKPQKQSRFGDYILGSTFREEEGNKVKHGWRSENGNKVMIKLIRRDTPQPGDQPAEIAVFRHISHPNIIRLYGMIRTEKHFAIIFEPMPGRDLLDYMNDMTELRYLDDKKASRLFAQLISAVGYLHAKGIVHRNLSARNLLLDGEYNIVITNFHFAATFDPGEPNLKQPNQPGHQKWDIMSTRYSINQYTAPEIVVQGGPYAGRKADIWSCGVILYVMVAGYLPFDDNRTLAHPVNLKQIFEYFIVTPTLLQFPSYVSPRVCDLLKRLLVPDPAKRAGLLGIARHIWLSEYSQALRHIGSDGYERIVDEEVNRNLQNSSRLPGKPTAHAAPQTLAESQVVQSPPSFQSGSHHSAPAQESRKQRLMTRIEEVLQEPFDPVTKRDAFFALKKDAQVEDRRTINRIFNEVYSQTKYTRLEAWEQEYLVRTFGPDAVPLQDLFVVRTKIVRFKLRGEPHGLSFFEGQHILVIAEILDLWYLGEREDDDGTILRGLFRPDDVETIRETDWIDRYGRRRTAPRQPPSPRANLPSPSDGEHRSTEYLLDRRRDLPPRRELSLQTVGRRGGLPPPPELSARIEEARTSAKLLTQIVQSTPSKEISGNALVKEFEARCLSAKSSMLEYINSDDPSADNVTKLRIQDAIKQILFALGEHRLAILQADSR